MTHIQANEKKKSNYRLEKITHKRKKKNEKKQFINWRNHTQIDTDVGNNRMKKKKASFSVKSLPTDPKEKMKKSRPTCK